MYQSAHINTIYNIQYNFSSQILVQSSIFGRLGFTGVANAYSNVVLDCYDKCTPIEELLRASTRNAFSLAQSGQYQSAIDTLETLEYTRKRNLHAHQYLSLAIGVLKLKRALRRHDLNTSQLLLTQLIQSASSSSPSLIVDSELAFQIRLLQIDYLQRLGSYPEALDKIEDLGQDLEAEDADVYQRIQVMILKAALFANVGKAVKGFSVAVKAGRVSWEGASSGQIAGAGVGGSGGASAAGGGSGSITGMGSGGKMMPLVWEAWAAVALILCELEEYDAARRILDAVIPQAHASGGISAAGSSNSSGGLGGGVGAAAGDLGLLAKVYSLQADAFMGMAGQAEEDSLARSRNMSKADGFLDKSLKCKSLHQLANTADLHQQSG
jgi:anaphase-promoting complex subunit 5